MFFRGEARIFCFYRPEKPSYAPQPRACTAPLAPCHCEGAPRPWQSVIPLAPHPLLCTPSWYFLPPAAESTQRTPPKPKFWKPSAPRMHPLWNPSCRANQPLNLKPCFHIVSAPTARRVTFPVALRMSRCLHRPAPLHFLLRTRRGRCPHRPASPHSLSRTRRGDPRGRPPAQSPRPSVGRGALTPPPDSAHTPCHP